MKRCIIIAVCLLLTGCVKSQDQVETAQALANELQASKDVIAAIETYNKFYNHCFYHEYDPEWKGGPESPKSYFVYSGNCDKAVLQELSRSQIDLGCLYKNWGTISKYNSDDCIIQRRKYGSKKNKDGIVDYTNELFSDYKSGFFDYKRFLPKGSRINSNAEWLNLVDFYNAQYCNSDTEELTTEEVQECKKQHKQTVIKVATTQTKLKCSTTYHRLYKKNFMESHIGWCGCACNKDTLEDFVNEWGEKHFCDTSGWESDPDFKSIRNFDCVIHENYYW